MTLGTDIKFTLSFFICEITVLVKVNFSLISRPKSFEARTI